MKTCMGAIRAKLAFLADSLFEDIPKYPRNIQFVNWKNSNSTQQML